MVLPTHTHTHTDNAEVNVKVNPLDTYTSHPASCCSEDEVHPLGGGKAPLLGVLALPGSRARKPRVPLGPCMTISENRAELKGTNYMGQTGFCKNLRFSAKICGFLRFSAKICASQMLEFPGKSENLQKSAKKCEFGSICPI